MEVVRQEGPVRVEKKVEDEEEVLPDGTIHHVHRERSSSVKDVQKCVKAQDGHVVVVEETKEEVPGSLKENIVETFEGPPRVVHEEKDYEVLEDGRKVHKHVVMNRMVHHIHTHQESFDSDHGHQEQDFDTDEVVPGTESTFVVDDDDDDDDDDSDDDGIDGDGEHDVNSSSVSDSRNGSGDRSGLASKDSHVGRGVNHGSSVE